VHIEPFEDALRLRYRIDGVLVEANVPGSIRRFHAAIVSRIKILSHLDIAEKRLPQDGRIKLKIAGREIDVRVSIIPSCSASWTAATRSSAPSTSAWPSATASTSTRSWTCRTASCS
jgi:type II secretory ATPase GspE/PulE/Tfp pilus assembly ATPase PilB-like protein